MSKFSTSFFILAASLFLFSFTASQKGIIKSKFPNMIGEYELIVIYRDGAPVEQEIPGKITMKITKGDDLIVFNNGKKVSKYEFNDRRSPLPMGTEDYIMFNEKNENSALFYKGDTIIQILYPNMYSENYFRKIKP